MSDKKNLFNEFSSVSSNQWKEKIIADLKGADYNKTLLTHTLEGITILPFYHRDNYRELEIPNEKKGFQICQSILIKEENEANYLALNAVKQGADCVQFIVNKIFDHKTVLQGLEEVTIYFRFLFFDSVFITELVKSYKKLNLYLNIDPVGNLVKTGNWFNNKQADFAVIKSFLQAKNDHITVLGVDVTQYQNAGANAVQQVAYALAHASEYLNFIDENKINTVKKILFNFSTGSNYFFEIAKLRAFRYLWNLLINEYKFEIEATIYTVPTSRNKTLFDYHVNMLRTTSENMSSVLGGADIISNVSFDHIFHKKNEFGERIARNQLIILKEESKIKNGRATRGSYYIEDITYEIAEKSLEFLKDIENNGGFIKQLYEGSIQQKIIKNAHKEQDLFDEGKLILLGTNKYLNTKDSIKDIRKNYHSKTEHKSKTLIQPIVTKRLAENLEAKRLESEY